MVKRVLLKIRWLVLGENYTREENTPYRNLHLLVKRAENRMKLKPKCPFCGSVMRFRRSHVVKAVPYRDDQVWKCTVCFHTSHFGLPISRETYVEEVKLRHGEYLLTPTYRRDERVRKEVLKRLRELGYFEFDIMAGEI